MYLQMNGVDDYIQCPPIAFDSIEMDFTVDSFVDGAYYLDARNGLAGGYYNNRDGLGSGWKSIFVNGVQDTSRPRLYPVGERQVIKLNCNVSTDNINIFSAINSSYQKMNGKLYDVKFYNGATLVAHYDMSTGTVADQSGNGNDATLTGGTWVSESTGTPVSYTYDSQQQIFADRTTRYDLTQQLYEDITQTFDTKLALYKNTQTNYNTEQVIYQTVSALYDTMQEIYSDGILRSYNYDLQMTIYEDTTQVYDTRQEMYTDTQESYDLHQAIYKATQSNQDINIVIYADRQQRINTEQRIYADKTYLYDTEQKMYDPDKSLIQTIELKGERKLNIYLQGEIKQEHIEGKRELTVNLKGVM